MLMAESGLAASVVPVYGVLGESVGQLAALLATARRQLDRGP